MHKSMVAIVWLEDKFKLDTWYVEHQSLWLDMKIFAKNRQKCRKDGISAEGEATMSKFIVTV